MQALELWSQGSCRNSQMLSLRTGSQDCPSLPPSRLQASSSMRTRSRSGASEFRYSWRGVQGVANSLPFAPDRKKEELNYMRIASAFGQAGFAPGGSSRNSRQCRMALVSSTSLPKRTSSGPRASERFVSPSSSGQAFEALRAWPNPLLKPTRNGIRQSAGKVRCTQSTSPAACRMPSRAV